MKVINKFIIIFIIANSMNLYANDTSQCMQYYWSQQKKIDLRILRDEECSDIWEQKNDKVSRNKEKILKNINLTPKNSNWMSTGTCKLVQYNDSKYFIYRAYLKHNKTDLIMIYNDNNSFAYSRELDRSKLKNGTFTDDDIIDVKLSCAKQGDDKYIVQVLNQYIVNETSIKNISKYKNFDWFK